MARLLLPAVLALSGFGQALADDPAPNSNDILVEGIKRLEAARKLPVPEPASTPYDNDPASRAVYLAEYRAGYQTVLAVVNSSCHMGIAGPTFQAYQDGWRDGKRDARAQHPDKAAALEGMTLEEYLRCVATDNKAAAKP